MTGYPRHVIPRYVQINESRGRSDSRAARLLGAAHERPAEIGNVVVLTDNRGVRHAASEAGIAVDVAEFHVNVRSHHGNPDISSLRPHGPLARVGGKATQRRGPRRTGGLFSPWWEGDISLSVRGCRETPDGAADDRRGGCLCQPLGFCAPPRTGVQVNCILQSCEPVLRLKTWNSAQYCPLLCSEVPAWPTANCACPEFK
jgi:hypothetical protein